MSRVQNRCGNPSCKCPTCECGTGCTCGVSNEVVCDPCKAFVAAKQQAARAVTSGANPCGNPSCKCPTCECGTGCTCGVSKEVVCDPCKAFVAAKQQAALAATSGGSSTNPCGNLSCKCPTCECGTGCTCGVSKEVVCDPCKAFVAAKQQAALAATSGGSSTNPCGNPSCKCPTCECGTGCTCGVSKEVVCDPCKAFVAAKQQAALAATSGGSSTNPCGNPSCKCPTCECGTGCTCGVSKEVVCDPCKAFVAAKQQASLAATGGGSSTNPCGNPSCKCPTCECGTGCTCGVSKEVVCDPCKAFVAAKQQAALAATSGGSSTNPCGNPSCKCPTCECGTGCTCGVSKEVVCDPCKAFVAAKQQAALAATSGGSSTNPCGNPSCKCPTCECGTGCTCGVSKEVVCDPCKAFVAAKQQAALAATSGGSSTNPCGNPSCKCPTCECGTGCTCGVSKEVVCDPCKAFVAAKQQAALAATSGGSSTNPCGNPSCKCPTCECGTGCTCGVSKEVVCDPCKAFVAAKQQAALAATSGGSSTNPCGNPSCKCPTCECGTGCTCGVSKEVVCDPCKKYVASRALPNSTSAARYGRQMLVADIGVAGQRKLELSRVLVVGAGGLGSAMMLQFVYCVTNGLSVSMLGSHSVPLRPADK